MIIGLSYKMRVGKDTSADYLVKTYSFKKDSFAKSLKEGIGKGVFGFTDEQFESLKAVVDPFWGVTPREVLQKAGTEFGRHVFGENIWIKTLERRIKSTLASNIVISDCRYINEAEAIKAWGGIVVRIDRDLPGNKSTHISETELDGWDKFDVVINNNGTFEELYHKLDNLVFDYVLTTDKNPVVPEEELDIEVVLEEDSN
jgi:hypothetical protein